MQTKGISSASKCQSHRFFSIKTSNIGAEAELELNFLGFLVENVFKCTFQGTILQETNNRQRALFAVGIFVT